MKIDRLVSLALVVLVSLSIGGCVEASKGAASPAGTPSTSQRDPSDDSYMDRYDHGDRGAPRVSRSLDHHLGAL
jgi:hypothetical protein